MLKVISILLAVFTFLNYNIVFANETNNYPVNKEIKNTYSLDTICEDDFLGEMTYKDFKKKEDNILYFEMNSPAFEKFISFPDINSIKYLFNNSSDGNIYEFYKSATNHKLTKLLLNNKNFYIQQDELYAKTVIDGQFNLHEGWFIYLKLENLQNILNKRGINENIIQRSFLRLTNKNSYYQHEPLILWIETDKNDYFMIYELKDVDLTNPEQYEFYYYTDLYKRFQTKIGSIKYNNIELKDRIIFQDQNFYVPVRDLFNLLGEDIKWYDNPKTIEFSVMDERYKYELDNEKHILKYINGEFSEIQDYEYTKLDIYIKSINFSEFIHNNKMYISSMYFNKFLKIYNNYSVVDYEKCNIEIKHKS